MNKNFIYIYNPFQSDYLLKNGLTPIEIGLGKKKDVYVKFPRNEKTEEVLTRWANRNK